MTGLTSLVNTVLSGMLNVTGNSTFYRTLNNVSSGSDKFMVDSSGNVSAVGTLCLPALASSVVNGGTSLDIKCPIPNPIANNTYQEFMTIANSTSSRLSGGAWSIGVVSVLAEVKIVVA